MRRTLPKKFFARDAVTVARELIGKYLVRDGAGAFMITETEGYDGFDDLASHASRGQTPRNSVMFGRPGVLYVYLVYGFHDMLNIVTGPVGYPAAVLIRGVEGISGPGRLTKKLGISRREHNGMPLGKETGVWIEDWGAGPIADKIKDMPRVGVDYAGPIWANKPYRFVLDIDT